MMRISLAILSFSLVAVQVFILLNLYIFKYFCFVPPVPLFQFLFHYILNLTISLCDIGFQFCYLKITLLSFLVTFSSLAPRDPF